MAWAASVGGPLAPAVPGAYPVLGGTVPDGPETAPAPAVGDDFAVGRALVDLGHQLLRAGVRDATGPAETE